MPAKKIIDAVGSTCDVIGSSIATVTAGPRPGNTPIAVPTAQPTNAHSRLIGVAAVAMPASSWAPMSISRRRGAAGRLSTPARGRSEATWGLSSQPAGTGDVGQADAEHEREEPEGRRRHQKPGDEIHRQALHATVPLALSR